MAILLSLPGKEDAQCLCSRNFVILEKITGDAAEHNAAKLCAFDGYGWEKRAAESLLKEQTGILRTKIRER